MNKFLYHIDNELNLVKDKINKELTIKKAGMVSSYARLGLSHLDSTIRPAIVILSSKMFGDKKEPTIAFAGIVQITYLASKTHAQVTEKDPQPGIEIDPRDGCQFPVLVGDFLFGKSFKLLGEAGINKYLSPLAEIMCQISEGSTMQCQLARNNLANDVNIILEIVRKETAELFGGCCAIAADIGGATKRQMDHMYNFGINFGCGYGLLQRGATNQEASIYFNLALDELINLPSTNARQQLIELTEVFKREEIIFQRMVG